jgi:bifunctional DNase/RNase
VLELEVVGVRVESPSNQPLVLLRETQGARSLPIWIGPVEASIIAQTCEGRTFGRPQTHDLMVAIIEALTDELLEVRITGVSEGVFVAELLFASGARVDARPSDAIVLSLKTGVRIWCEEQVMENEGLVTLPDEEVEVLKFREFLDEVEPEDFD